MNTGVVLKSYLVLIPAFNEAANIDFVIREARQVLGNVPILVADDCSTDSTAALARAAGAQVLSLPYHLGLGGVVQAGYRYAHEMGFHTVVRIDGDGQHDPKYIPALLEALQVSGAQMVIGSRFLGTDESGADHEYTSASRKWAIRLFRAVLRPMLGKEVRDPTSGFVAVNHQALEVFSHSFPLEYPEIEALVVLQRRAFQFLEVPVKMRPRRAGVSTITAPKALYYLLHVLLGVLVNILRFERHRWR
jgi:glycosyltransferase involved in cell wall biosynthesis